MKKKQAFKHDFGARNDVRLVNVRLHHGMTGIGIYWCIIEMMYESESGRMPVDGMADIAFEFGVDVSVIQSIVNDFGLFANDGTMYWSPSAIERMEHRRMISAIRQQAGKQGGAPMGNQNARTNSAPVVNPDTQEQPESEPETAGTTDVPQTEPVVPVPEPTPETPKRRSKPFVKPTLEQAQAEIDAKGYTFTAEAFIAFYDSNGWMIGKNHMKSWKSAMVTWNVRHKADAQAGKTKTNNNNVNDIWT